MISTNTGRTPTTMTTMPRPGRRASQHWCERCGRKRTVCTCPPVAVKDKT
jgi:hypothetical protein